MNILKHFLFVSFLIEFQTFQTTEEMEEPVYTKDELREFNKKNKIHPDEYLEVRLNSKLFSWIYLQLVCFSFLQDFDSFEDGNSNQVIRIF